MQTYVTSSDKEFAAATIQAIGRCASNIAEITDACLNGLVNLLQNRDGQSAWSAFCENRISLYCLHCQKSMCSSSIKIVGQLS